MGGLLKTRLRHIQAIHFYNIPAISLAHDIEWFYTIESSTESQVLYVSENRTVSIKNNTDFTQPGFELSSKDFRMLVLQFDEFDTIEDNNHNLTLTIYAVFNSGDDSNSPQTVKLICLPLCLDTNLKNCRGITDISQYKELSFCPVFQLNDGQCYIYRDTGYSGMQPIKRSPLSNFQRARTSYTYNSLLKLNKLLEYYYELNQEITELKHDIDNKCENSKIATYNQPTEKLHEFVTEMAFKIEDQNMTKAQVAASIQKSKLFQNMEREKLKTPCEFPLTDDSNETIKNYTIQRQDYNDLKTKKIMRLLNVFESTKIISDFFERDKYDYPVFNHIDPQELIAKSRKNEKIRLLINSKLGYYILLLKILTEAILELPLRYSVQFYGSTSLVDLKLPLYILPMNSKQNQSFVDAARCFNVDISQLQNYIKQAFRH